MSQGWGGEERGGTEARDPGRRKSRYAKGESRIQAKIYLGNQGEVKLGMKGEENGR